MKRKLTFVDIGKILFCTASISTLGMLILTKRCLAMLDIYPLRLHKREACQVWNETQNLDTSKKEWESWKEDLASRQRERPQQDPNPLMSSQLAHSLPLQGEGCANSHAINRPGKTSYIRRTLGR